MGYGLVAGLHDDLGCWRSIAEDECGLTGVVQQNVRTPTGPSFASCCIPGTHGRVFGLASTQAIERPDGVVFRCDLTASESERWLEIPAWMFDRSTCARCRSGRRSLTPTCRRWRTLAALLRDVLNRGSQHRTPPISGVSPLSGDQNRGEAHAKPEQPEVGTPARAAANRPVRRERASGQAACRRGPDCRGRRRRR